MRFLATLKMATRALRRNLMRTTLTMLGVVIGVGAVIAMVSIGNGAKAQVEARIASLGENVILIFAGSTHRNGVRTGWVSAGTLKTGDAIAISREVPGVVAVSPEVRSSAQVAAGNQNWYTQILGEGPDYLQVRQWPLAEGAMFTDEDVRHANKIAVIGHTVAQQLFGENDPYGQIIRIKNVPFVVAGELVPKGLSVSGSDQDDVIVVPYSSAMKRLLGVSSLRSILVQTASPLLLASAQDQIAALLRQRHRIGPERDDDFTVRNQQEITEAATATSRVMTVLLGAIASVSLLVGGIGIMNIMLVSVTEGTREIGIRVAVGAKGRDVLLQFLIEATTLSGLGGVVGIMVGIAISVWLAARMQWPTLTPPSAIVIAFLFSAMIGIFFGFYPARKAANLDPIEALRFE